MAKKTKAKAKVAGRPKATVKFIKREADWLPRFSLFFFDRPRFTALLFLVILFFGLISYTTLLKREGFPSINFPVASINGAYFVNDASIVDQDVAKPISEVALQQDGVSSVQASSLPNFFNVFIQYEEDVDAQAAAAELENVINSQNLIPKTAQVQVSAPYFSAIGPSIEPIDIGISFYAKQESSSQDIVNKAEEYAEALRSKGLELVKDVFVLNPYEQAVDPVSGQLAIVQQSFDRFGLREVQEGQAQNNFYNSVIIGVQKTEAADLLDFDHQVRESVKELNKQEDFSGYNGFISASFAPNIEENISELQRELLIALLAVLIVGSLVIAIRASIITVISLVLVIFAVLGLLYVMGYTLNVITLFALILSLALIVDDTIIMIEAIDARRKKQKDARKTIDEATSKISRAMLSATFTAILSFAPLLFVGGILGTFIRTIPVTVISALIISLLVSLIFLPFLSRFILLREKTMGEEGVKEVAAGIEQKFASFIAKPMMWAKGNTKRLISVGLSAVFIGFLFIGLGGYYASKVTFNIFPQSKDANDLDATITFNPGTTLEQAEAITDKANKVLGESVGEFLAYTSYFNSGSERSASASIKLISYNDRDPKSGEIISKLQTDFNEKLPCAPVKVSQVDAGPPAQPFVVAIETDDLENGYKLANDVSVALQGMQLTRPSGTTAKVINVTVSNPAQIVRVDNQQRITVSAEFDDNDTTTLFGLTQARLEEIYSIEKIESFGLQASNFKYDLGQESQNQESFATLALAFPLVLLMIYILLAIQFKSLLQPLLIFFAIPFSLFGIGLSLYLTDNAFSFFAMLGFFALIGLSIKNTILLTDYANQARRNGRGVVDSAVEALGERFRPLLATSLTAIVALTPLSIISPFWQALAVLIIFGLLSSTLLVITVFPYYYLGSEFIRQKINRKQGIVITLLFVAIVALLVGLLT